MDSEKHPNCKGENCETCVKENLGDKLGEVNLNVNAKEFVPKSKEKLNFNLKAEEYKPSEQLQGEEVLENGEEVEEDEIGDDIDKIMNDIENDDALDELEEEDESDEDKWFPKYKDCECCKGFVYKCNGPSCQSLGECFCKMKIECEENL
jgi:hypothetical protein